MTLRHMKIFIEVYQNSSITRAAENLYITQPVVTRAIKELEQYYGVLLFERISQRLSVTEAGKQLYAYALHIVDSFERMETGLRNWDELGVIRIGASVTLGSILLPKVLKEFYVSHPRITVKVTVTNGSQLQSMLENNEIDFALIEGNISNDNLVAEKFAEDRLILLVPPDGDWCRKGEIYLADLLKYPMMLRENKSMSRLFLNHVFSLHQLPLNPFMESVSTHAIVQSVHEGLGISILPEHMVYHEVESGFVSTFPVKDESFRRNNYIVYHKNKLLTPAMKDIILFCFQNSKMDNPD